MKKVISPVVLSTCVILWMHSALTLFSSPCLREMPPCYAEITVCLGKKQQKIPQTRVLPFAHPWSALIPFQRAWAAPRCVPGTLAVWHGDQATCRKLLGVTVGLMLEWEAGSPDGIKVVGAGRGLGTALICAQGHGC